MRFGLKARAVGRKAFALARWNVGPKIFRMISVEEARAVIARTARPLEAMRGQLLDCRGRILREDVIAAEELPAFDRAAMDGYAVDLQDSSPQFRVVAEIQPGAARAVTLRAGECARIFTGAALPAGASQVIMQEDVERRGEFMVPLRRTRKTHVRQRGEDAARGSTLLHAGARLGPVELSLLAQIGCIGPLVSPRARVLHLTTGNELVDPSAAPQCGQIRDSNSTLIAALLAERGALLVEQDRCSDSLEALIFRIKNAAAPFDLLLISGGASVGDYDFGARALEALGLEIHFRQLNLRPGKPLVFASRQRQLAFVVPGNPVSHLVTFHLLIASALDCLENKASERSLVRAKLATNLAGNPRETWSPARVKLTAVGLIAQPLPWQSSGDLCGIAGANALLRIPAGSADLNADDSAECLLLDRRF